MQSEVDQNQEKFLDKIRALLAKAESTSFQDEADALFAKAQELMTKYSIDQSMLRAHAVATGAALPDTRIVVSENPYAEAKAFLLQYVADANNCRAVFNSRTWKSTMVGYESDLEIVELLYTSLLIQATSAMLAEGPQKNWDGRSTTKSFRRAFLHTYGRRIGDRLEQASESSAAQTGADIEKSEGASVALVLLSQKEAVENALVAQFPNLKSVTATFSNTQGYLAGLDAADHADLGSQRRMKAG